MPRSSKRNSRSATRIAAILILLAHVACMTEPEEEPLEQTVTELVVVHGDGQYQGRGRRLHEPVSVRAYDEAGQVVSGAKVEFVVQPGNGSVSSEWARTDQLGVASTWWTLGDIAGPHSMTAAVLDGPIVEISATARPGDFDIQVVVGEGFSDEQRKAMRAAAERWTAVIVGDKPDYSFPANFEPPGWCQQNGLTSAPGQIDDVRWDVVIVDDPRNFLMRGYCHYRVGPSGMTEPLWFFLAVSPSVVDAVTEHVEPEAWQAWLSQLVGRSLAVRLYHLVIDSIQGDAHFADDATIAAFDAAGGVSWSGGSKVPLEPAGFYPNLAWRCSVFGHEMMSDALAHFMLERGRRPMSAITVQLLAAVDFEVDVSKADPYTLPEPGTEECVGDITSHPLEDATVVVHQLPFRVENKVQ